MGLLWFFVFAGLVASPGLAVETQAQTMLQSVLPRFETPPLFDDDAGGNADGDDPAIWVHPHHPPLSLVVATKKNAGLSVYTLRGHELQAIATPPAPGPDDAPGRFNNVDILYGFQLGGRSVDLAVTTDRGRDQLRFYVIELNDLGDRQAPLQDVTSTRVPFVFSLDQAQVNDQRTAYGLAVWKDRDGRAYAFVSQRERTVIAKVQLLDAGDSTVSYQTVGSVTLPKRFTLPNDTTWEPCSDPGTEPQVEGMVVDSDRRVLYAAQEDVGIWRMDLNFANRVLIDRVREYGVPWEFDAEQEECVVLDDQDPGFGGRHLAADAEGLTIYYGPNLEGYVLASSQGDNTFAVYERKGDNTYLGSFEVKPAHRRPIDGVQASDGAAVINVPLNAIFDAGLLVVHDGENTPEVLDDAGEVRPNTNFKFMRWEDIAKAFDPPLLIDPHSRDPRPKSSAGKR
jgi:3-phytase